MTTSANNGRTEAAIRARRSAATTMLRRIEKTLQQMKMQHADITVADTARRAQVSRTFLYQNSAARQLIADFTAEAAEDRHRADAERFQQVQASWRERALNAEDSLRSSHQEIVSQRDTIADILGRIRDLESDLPPDGAQQLISENTTLKRRVRELSREITRLQERLEAARNNNHSLDSRIADLEAQLLTGPQRNSPKS